MKYLFIIFFCLGLYRFSSHSLRMKVTQTIDCTTYKHKKKCVENTNCEWNTNCQTKIIPKAVLTTTTPDVGTGNNAFSATGSTSITSTQMQSASLIK